MGASLVFHFHFQEKIEKILISKRSKYLNGANYAVYETIPEEYRHHGDSPILEMKVYHLHKAVRQI